MAFGGSDLIRGNYWPLVGVTLSEGTIGLCWERPYQRELLAFGRSDLIREELMAFGGSDLIRVELLTFDGSDLIRGNYWIWCMWE